MPLNKTLRHHADLVDKMAGALGVDLEESVMRGDLSPDALPDMVLRCSACANPAQCADWLSRNPRFSDAAGVNTSGPDTAPYYCRNAEVFDDLKRF
ncbi:MAG: DUF6455 family protein [Rhodobacterales bacterium]